MLSEDFEEVTEQHGAPFEGLQDGSDSVSKSPNSLPESPKKLSLAKEMKWKLWRLIQQWKMTIEEIYQHAVDAKKSMQWFFEKLFADTGDSPTVRRDPSMYYNLYWEHWRRQKDWWPGLDLWLDWNHWPELDLWIEWNDWQG